MYALITWFLIIHETLSCNSITVVYVITWQHCKLHYAGSVMTFKERFRIHKSDVNKGKKSCGAAKDFLECCTSDGTCDNLKIQLMESVNLPDNLLEQKLWQRQKCITLIPGLNSPSDWY